MNIKEMSDKELLDWLERENKVDENGLERSQILGELFKRAGGRSIVDAEDELRREHAIDQMERIAHNNEFIEGAEGNPQDYGDSN